MLQAKGQVVVVGGTKGLGKLVVEQFLEQGYSVSIISRSAPEKLPAGAQHVAVDLETLTEAKDVVKAVLDFGGPIRYLVFCQRYRGKGDSWQGEIQVSLSATKYLIEAFTPNFVTGGDRAIGVVSSVYAHFVGGSQPASYHVAKAGLNQLVKFYAWTLGRQDIRINAIMPLTYLKPESRAYYEGQPELLALYEKFVPLKRMGEAKDSANLLNFLCSDKAAFINGQAIYVDGGVSVVWPEELAKSLSTI